MATALAALLLGGVGCGKKGDPQPPLRRAPQGPAELAVAQRGGRVVVRLRAPLAWSDGSRLPVVELELLRAQLPGDFAKVARARRLRAAPGEALTESEPAPAPGTKLRFAARTRAQGKLSPLSAVITLEVRDPPPPPGSFRAERMPARVKLSWTPPAGLAPAPAEAAAAPAPPSPTPSEPPAATAPAPAPSPRSAAGPVPAAASPVAEPGPASASPAPAPPGFWVYRRPADADYGAPLTKTPVGGSEVDDDTPPQGAACYVVRTVVSSDPLVESADSEEACVPGAGPEAVPSPGGDEP